MHLIRDVQRSRLDQMDIKHSMHSQQLEVVGFAIDPSYIPDRVNSIFRRKCCFLIFIFLDLKLEKD